MISQESHVIYCSVFRRITSEISSATTRSACTDGCSSSNLRSRLVNQSPEMLVIAGKRCATYQRKLSWAVPVASVQTPGSLVLSLSSNTQACTAPVTLSGAVPFKKRCGCVNMSIKSVCESNRPTLWPSLAQSLVGDDHATELTDMCAVQRGCERLEHELRDRVPGRCKLAHENTPFGCVPLSGPVPVGIRVG